MNKKLTKILHVFLAAVFVSGSAYVFYPIGEHTFEYLSSRTFVSPYFVLGAVESEADISLLPPAKAVPILMYHGIVRNSDGVNTARKTFIKQMETLKKEGYETISVADYYRFRQGEYTLPPRPIILTFDDGRRDSFYPADAILRKLGFKATIFIATERANAEDLFFLSWKELRKLRDSGRWEIEAHGRRSHDDVLMNGHGDLGLYLSTRIWDKERGLEPIPDYEKRVVADYIDGIDDLKNNLGIDARFFAVPLNDFGTAHDMSNYEGALAFNKILTSHFFNLAFYQVSLNGNGAPRESFYNGSGGDPYNIKRLEVKEMDAYNLLMALRYFEPNGQSAH